MQSRGLFCLIAVSLGLASAAQDIVVVMASPDWKAKGQTLEPGTSLSATQMIEYAGTGEGQLVLDCGEKGWIHYTRKAPHALRACGDNEVGNRVDKGRENGSAAPSGWTEAIAGFFTRAQSRPSFFGSRGPGGDPNDAVVLLKNGDLHLAPALVRVLEGDYCFSLKSLNSSSDHTATQIHLKWDKSDEPEGLVKAPDVTPGVYVLEKMKVETSGSCSADAESVPAWILVAPESDYDALDAQWKANRAWFQDLSDNDPAVLLTMKHAAIAQLSESLKH